MVFGMPRKSKGGPVTVAADSVAHAGWGYKQSKHFEIWRKRWMVLLKNGTLLTFEDEVAMPIQRAPGRSADEEQNAPAELGIPTERFVVRALQESAALGRRNGRTTEDTEEVLHLYVDYLSTRDRWKRRMMIWDDDEQEERPPTRRRFICLDADTTLEKLNWKDALREVLRKLPQMSAEDIVQNRLESRDLLLPDAEPQGTHSFRPSEKARHHEEGCVSDADTNEANDLKGWSAGLYHQQRR